MKAVHPATVLALVLTACAAASSPEPSAPARSGGEREVIVATTTTTQDSGLLDVLLPAFERHTGYGFKTIVQGTGAILALAARGEADVVLSHSPDAERHWMAQGNGTERSLVMYNDYIIVGPPSDPVNARSATDAAAALRAIADKGAQFVSRGDHSGTHARELALWNQGGIEPRGQPWYVESGSGQGQTLTIADQRNAYALADRGTWLAFKNRLQLGPLVEGDPQLLNVYHVMPVNPDRFPNLKLNTAGGQAFADFLVSAEGQRLIDDFGRDRYGQSLFTPAGGRREADLFR
jgi:tungstate transport system substrate-binding protein